MDGMRERIARALADAVPYPITRMEMDNAADAVLAELREPDEEMKRAADEVSFDLTEPGALSVILKGYTAMIDHASKEEG